MSVNSSSPSNSSLDSVFGCCTSSRVSIFIGTAFSVTRTLLLIPLSIFVLYLGHQRWRRQRSFATMSHSDIFTYNMAALELICCLGSAFFFWGSSSDLPKMSIVGYWLNSVSQSGEAFFHVLTCVERYLAVVHPVTYLGLRNAGGVRIRNISIGCVWLLCCVMSSVILLRHPTLTSVSLFCLLAFSSVVVSFCSLSVLRVLIRPGPGEGGRDKKHVDQSKQRAFHIVMAITVVLWLWLAGLLVSFTLDHWPLLSHDVTCVVRSCVTWCNLPCSLMLSLLYLHRTGKLSCCCCSSGEG